MLRLCQSGHRKLAQDAQTEAVWQLVGAATVLCGGTQAAARVLHEHIDVPVSPFDYACVG